MEKRKSISRISFHLDSLPRVNKKNKIGGIAFRTSSLGRSESSMDLFFVRLHNNRMVPAEDELSRIFGQFDLKTPRPWAFRGPFSVNLGPAF